MDKLTNIFLAAILTIGIAGLIVSLNADQNIEQNLGFGGYNELGISGITQTTVDVGIVSGTTASTTAYKILSENWGRMYAEIQLDIAETNEMRLYFGETTYSDGSTTTYASSTDYWALGMSMSTTTTKKYTIGPDNLWKGEVWGISTTSTTTVRTLEK